jgi:hypothetical protein
MSEKGYGKKWSWLILKVLLWNLPTEAEKTTNTLRIASLWAKIGTRDFLNTKQ